MTADKLAFAVLHVVVLSNFDPGAAVQVSELVRARAAALKNA